MSPRSRPLGRKARSPSVRVESRRPTPGLLHRPKRHPLWIAIRAGIVATTVGGALHSVPAQAALVCDVTGVVTIAGVETNANPACVITATGRLNIGGTLTNVGGAGLTNNGFVNNGGSLINEATATLTNNTTGPHLGAGSGFVTTGVLDNAGALNNTGNLVVNGTGNLANSGSIFNAGGFYVDELAGLANSGTLTNDGEFRVGFGGANVNNTGLFINNNRLDVYDERYAFNNGGTLNNAGSTEISTLDNAGTFTNSGTALVDTLINAGALLNSGTLLIDERLDNLAGATVSTSGILARRVEREPGEEPQIYGDNSTLNNQGKLEVTQGGIARFGVTENLSGNTLSGGAWSVLAGTGTAILELGQESPSPYSRNVDIDTIATGTEVLLSGAGAQFVQLDTLASNAGSLTIADGHTFDLGTSFSNTGTLAIAADGEVTSTGTIDNQGGVTVETDGTLDASTVYNRIGARVENAGTVTASSTLTIEAGASVDNSGVLSAGGSLAFDGNLANSGNVGVDADVHARNGSSLESSGSLTTGGKLTVDGGATLTNSGALTAGGKLVVDGDMTNSGTVDVNAEVNLNAGARFDNSGTLNAGGIFTADRNVANTGAIHAAGNLYLDADFTNAGLLRTDGNAFGFGTVTNVAGATLSIQGLAPLRPNDPYGGTTFALLDGLDSSGTLDLAHGALAIQYAANVSGNELSGGTWNVTDAALALFTNAIAPAGTRTKGDATNGVIYGPDGDEAPPDIRSLAANTHVTLGGNWRFNQLEKLVSNAGALTVEADATLELELETNDGTITNRGLFIHGASDPIVNRGAINNEAGGTVDDALVRNYASVSNGANSHWDSGTIYNHAPAGEVRNAGTFNDVALVNYGSATNVSGGIISAGSIENLGTAMFTNKGGATVNNSRVFNLAALTNEVDATLSLASLNNIDGTIANAGRLDINGFSRNYAALDNAATGEVRVNADFRTHTGSTITNAGRFEVAAGGRLAPFATNVNGTFSQSAGSTVNNGVIRQSSIDIQGGSISGSGSWESLAGPMTLGADVDVNPGNSAGTLTVLGSISTAATFNIEIGDGGFDVFDVTGTASFEAGSVFNFLLDALFVPSDGDDFEFLTAAAIDGFPANVTYSISGLGSGFEFAVFEDGESDLHIRFSASNNSTEAPEPGTLWLLLGGIPLLTRRWWRRCGAAPASVAR